MSELSLGTVGGPVVQNRYTGGLHIGWKAKKQTNKQGPVVRTPVSADPELNFKLGLVFFLSKALSPTIFSILFRVSNHQIVSKRMKLNLLSRLSDLSSNFALTPGYLDPASNNPAQDETINNLKVNWSPRNENLRNIKSKVLALQQRVANGMIAL